MDSISNIFSHKKPNSPVMKGIQTAMILEFVMNWLKQEWGAMVETHARAVSLKDGILTIACVHPTLANEIKFKETALKASINTEFGDKTVERVKFVV